MKRDGKVSDLVFLTCPTLGACEVKDKNQVRGRWETPPPGPSLKPGLLGSFWRVEVLLCCPPPLSWVPKARLPPNGMRLPMSEDKCRNSGYPQDEGATVLAHPWAIWAHKCTIAHRLGNSALMHKSSTDCLRHDLKGLLEKRWLVYVPHTVDSYLWYYEWGWGITACLW